MKITTPLSKIEEIDHLASAGADEFYCSIVPEDWLSRFGSSATSRRPFGNLAKESDLELALKKTHDQGKQLSLVMNAQNYTSEQIDCLMRLADRFANAGGDALIVSEPSLLGLLGQKGYDMGLHLSSIAACRNHHSAAFFHALGATRIILPRDMTLREIEQISRRYPNVEYEAFVLNDGCVFEEGVCHTIHLPSHLGGAICMDNYQYTYNRIDGAGLSNEEHSNLIHNDKRYAEWLWYRFGCGFSVTEEGYPYGPCGLCAMSKLHDMGVKSVKIAGRDAPLERKVKSVSLVRMLLDRIESGDDFAECAAFAKGIRQTPDLCRHGQMCYYPEVTKKSGLRPHFN
ncbi:MAG: U32 family peptidase [Emcibacter sp.]|nr:U32 family peptidase [Emcibacter sp.]